MKPGTAPGEDSIPAEFFTLFMHPEAGDLGAPSESSETPMGRHGALFQLPLQRLTTCAGKVLVTTVTSESLNRGSPLSSSLWRTLKGGDVHDVGSLVSNSEHVSHCVLPSRLVVSI
jgi:hypothetical protein